jgi:hypothetical protein
VRATEGSAGGVGGLAAVATLVELVVPMSSNLERGYRQLQCLALLWPASAPARPPWRALTRSALTGTGPCVRTPSGPPPPGCDAFAESELGNFTPTFLWLLRDFYFDMSEGGREVRNKRGQCPWHY